MRDVGAARMSNRAMAASIAVVVVSALASCSTFRTASSSLCAVKAWGPSMDGEAFRAAAIFRTDLRHHDSLGDPACPDFQLAIEKSSAEADDTVEKFFGVVGSDPARYVGRDIPVEVLARFFWSAEHTINADLAPSKQLRVPARGVVALEEVVSFD